MSKKKHSEQPNKEDIANRLTIETEDYQFLLSLEESRKSTIYSRVSTIITCASLLWAMAIIIPELFGENAISTGKFRFQLAIVVYSVTFFVCLFLSAIAIAEEPIRLKRKRINQNNADIKSLYLNTKDKNDEKILFTNLAWAFLIVQIAFLFLIVLFALIIV